MNLLAPLFLAGALAIAVPVLVHLRRRKSRERFVFPSLMFLEEVPHATVRRRRLRDLPLLALRTLAVLLLALAFAQPTLQGGVGGKSGAAREVFLLVDRSASMGIGARWSAAQDGVEASLDGLENHDRVTLAFFDEVVTVPVLSSDDPTLVLSALRAARPRDRKTSLSAGLRVIRPLLAEAVNPEESDGISRSIECVIVSDFQKNGVLDIDNLQLPSGVKLTLIDVSKQRGAQGSGASDSSFSANRWVQGVQLERDSSPERGRREQARITSVIGLDDSSGVGSEASDATMPEVDVSLWLDGREISTQKIRLQGRQTTVVFEGVTLDASRSLKGEIRLAEDWFPADDTFYFTASAGDALTVVLGTGRDRRSGIYVQRSLESARSPSYSVESMRAGQINRSTLAAASAVVVSDVGELSSNALEELERFVRDGGGLLAGYGRGAVRTPLPEWLEMRKELQTTQSRKGLHLAYVEEEHPVFASLRDADWGIAPFFRAFSLGTAETSTVDGSGPVAGGISTGALARFSDGTVAMAERRLGKGKIVGFASTLDTTWNEFPRHGTFLAWLDQVMQHLVLLNPTLPSYTVGEPSLIDAPEPTSGQWILVAPGGELTNLAVQTRAATLDRQDEPGNHQFLVTFEQAGHSLLRPPEAESTERWFAANLERSESHMMGADLEVLKAKLASPSVVGDAVNQQGAQGSRSSFWRFVLYALLLLLLSAGYLASRARRLDMARLRYSNRSGGGKSVVERSSL